MRVVVVGYGPVGARLVEGMLPAVRAGEAEVTVLGAEADDAYNRVLLAEYAVGRAARERLETTDTAAARAAGVAVRLAEAAVAIDRHRRVVRTSSGDRVPYDRLVLAVGARANVVTLDGLERSRRERLARAETPQALDAGAAPLPAGVVVLRDLADAAIVAAAVRERRRIVVLGAGVLLMEFAIAAAECGAEVVVAFHGEAPMARTLDRGGGLMLGRAARAAGVELSAHSRAEGVVLHADGSGFAALLCADGRQLDGDLLVISAGVSARVELAAAADLAVATGILVDDDARSWTDPAIFAVGDCAQVAAPGTPEVGGRVPGSPAGLIGPGWRQADAVAARLCDEAAERAHEPARTAEQPSVVMLKAEGIDVVAGGDVSAEPWDDPDPCARHGRQVTQWADPARGAYAKMVTRDGVLEGFVSVGMPRTGAELTLLFERQSELPADRSSLLSLDGADAGAAASADPFAPDATVCWCNGVTVERITTAAAAGSDTVACIGSATRAGTGCGGCRGRIAELLARATPAGA